MATDNRRGRSRYASGFLASITNRVYGDGQSARAKPERLSSLVNSSLYMFIVCVTSVFSWMIHKTSLICFGRIHVYMGRYRENEYVNL